VEKKSSGLRERFNFCNGWNISNTPELYINDVAASLKRLEKRRSVINRVETVSGCPRGERGCVAGDLSSRTFYG
jgi:hypothetical protein